jgi:hypothetical protein
VPRQAGSLCSSIEDFPSGELEETPRGNWWVAKRKHNHQQQQRIGSDYKVKENGLQREVEITIGKRLKIR